MSDEEKNKLYQEARATLLALSKEELDRLGSYVNITNGLVVGSVASIIVFGSLNPDFFYAYPAFAGGLSLIANILCRLKKREIIKKVDEDANKVVSEIAELSSMMNDILPSLFGGAASFMVGGPEQNPFMGMGFMPVGIKIHVGSKPVYEEESIEADYEVLDENGLSLKDKCELLIQYGLDVAYPGYEEDVQNLQDILTVLDSGYPRIHNMDEYTVIVNGLEGIMLDKAYKYYTGDLAR